MYKIISVEEIREALPHIDLLPIIEHGFAAYSKGLAIVPPVGELVLEAGEVHIKYGYIKNDPYYVIKIASGFYDNHTLGLPTGDGLMIVFSQKTGVLEAVLVDNACLTDSRTAAAGAICAKYLAPDNVEAIGIVGAGVQGTLQLSHLQAVIDCNKVFVWTREPKEVDPYLEYFKDSPLEIEFVSETREVAANANLIVTTTPSKTPLLQVDDIRPGTHITAVGADTTDKIELDSAILKKADLVVSDSLPQSETRGEIYQAVKAGMIQRENVVELGTIIAQGKKARSDDNQITVADLTGVAVQDIQIATAILEYCEKNN